jgi:hypothetical protein
VFPVNPNKFPEIAETGMDPAGTLNFPDNRVNPVPPLPPTMIPPDVMVEGRAIVDRNTIPDVVVVMVVYCPEAEMATPL